MDRVAPIGVLVRVARCDRGHGSNGDAAKIASTFRSIRSLRLPADPRRDFVNVGNKKEISISAHESYPLFMTKKHNPSNPGVQVIPRPCGASIAMLVRGDAPETLQAARPPP